MQKASANTNTNTNTNNIFSELLSELTNTKKQARERASEISTNKANGFSTLVKQANKNSKAGFSYILHNANILSEQVLKALQCNASERARLDYNKASFILALDESKLKLLKIKVSESLKSELEQELKKQGKARAKAYLFSSK